MNRKAKGSTVASLVVFVTSGMLASVLGVRQYERATTTEGWVTSSSLEAGQIITPNSLQPSRVKRDTQAIHDPQQVLGKRLAVDKPAGEPVRAVDLALPAPEIRKTLAQHIPEGRVLFSLPLASDTTLPLSQLRGGDRLDVLVRSRNGVRTAATDVRLIGVMRPRSSQGAPAAGQKITSLLPQRPGRGAGPTSLTTLVLAVEPGHVYPLANITNKDAVSLILHSSLDVASGRELSVTPARQERPIEVMAGISRSTVFVKR